MEKVSLIKKVKRDMDKKFPVLMTYYKFPKRMGYFCHLKHPKTLNEKIQYLKLFNYPDNPLITKCADKYAVREYIIDKGYESLLVPLIGYWNKVDEIDFNNLPNSFVLKCNHGSGYNILCPDKNKFSVTKSKKLLNKWMNEDFSIRCAELQYKTIPRKIIAEKYLGREIYDYKFFCLNGIPRFMYISQEIPNTDGEVKCCFWDCNGELAEFERTDEHFYTEEERPNLPEKFEEMKKIASDLSKDFIFVRVDLFEIYGKIYFSELTFTPATGMMPLRPKEWDRKLGDMLKLD